MCGCRHCTETCSFSPPYYDVLLLAMTGIFQSHLLHVLCEVMQCCVVFLLSYIVLSTS